VTPVRGKTFYGNTLLDYSLKTMLIRRTQLHIDSGLTDRTFLVTLQSPLDEFVDTVCNAFDNLRQHHFVMKSQSSYLKSLKEDILDISDIVLLDFAENYSFVIQDAVQGFYWDNSQATLHPFAVYYKDSNDEVVCHSICMISNSLKHETASVHAIISIQEL